MQESQLRAVPKRSVREAIAHYVKNPPENSRVFEITPDDAQWILESYHDKDNNRSKKPQNIKRYAGDMRDGLWGLTGDTLKFSNASRLRDGQNRIFGCVKAEVPFTTHVVFGIEDALFDVMDRGKPRGADDVLKIAGYAHPGTLASACRWVHLLATDRVKLRDTYEPKEVLGLVAGNYPDLANFITAAQAINRTTQSPPGLVAAVLYLAAKKDAAKARDFARIWELGGQERRGKPIQHMLKRVQLLRTISSGRVNDVVRAALAVQAWNLFAQRRDGRISQLNWTLDQDFPQMIG